jgi:S-DNA-T family DNA segregation ATPase FtsK/SpoIIIE
MTDLIPRPQGGTDDKTLILESARQVLNGLPGVEAPAAPITVKKTAGVDAVDDFPLIPTWMRTPEGWAQWAGIFCRARRRGARRWVRRQGTAHGHIAQFGRGAHMTVDWIRGFEGVQVDALAHQAHVATKQSRKVNRIARRTPGMLRTKKELATKAALSATADAQSAIAMHKAAKKDRARWRNIRAAAVCAPCTAAGIAGFIELGWFGVVAAAAATFGTGAFIGRHADHLEDDWSTVHRSLGDGDALTPSMIDEALRAARVIGKEETTKTVFPPAIDKAGAFVSIVDLPPGVIAQKAMAKQDEIAGAFGVARSQIDLQKGDRDGRLHIWAALTDPFLKVRKSPLIGCTEPINTWRDGIPLVFDKRGTVHSVTISDYSMLFAGATRSGKGMALANLLAGSMLDPRVRVRLFDGKGTGEYVPFAPVLATFVRRNPGRLVEFLRVMVEEMNRRTEILVELQVSKASEQLIDKLGGIELIVVDELATYTAPKGPSKEHAEEIVEYLAQIAAVGAAVGIIVALATQFPEVGIVPSRLRGNCNGRMANRVESPGASNVILGDGKAGDGYDASEIENSKQTRGRGWLTTPDTGMVEVRSLFIDESTGEILPLIETGAEIRRKAGCLPGHYNDPVEAEMLRLTGASAAAGGARGNGGIVRATLIDHLVGAAERTGRGCVTTVEACEALAGFDSVRYARNEGEADTAYAARAGKTLKQQLAAVDLGLESVRVSTVDDKRAMGYQLSDLKVAESNARSVRI